MNAPLPATMLQLRSLIRASGELELSLAEVHSLRRANLPRGDKRLFKRGRTSLSCKHATRG